jgi:hypothetical protein
MHWETLEKQFPNQIETIFFFKQYHFLPHVYAFFLLLNNDLFFIYTNKTYIKIYIDALWEYYMSIEKIGTSEY